MAEAWWNRFHLAADDWGIFIAEPEWLKGRLWPYRKSMTTQKILSILSEYEKTELIFCWDVRTVYAQCTHNERTKYGFFTGWFEHQTMRYLSKRKFPAPPEENYQFIIEKQNEHERTGTKHIKVMRNCAYSERTVCAQCAPETEVEVEVEVETENTNTVRPLFEELWKAYPIAGRRGKQKSEDEFKKLHVDQLNFDAMIQALEKQIIHKATSERERKFCPEFPHLERWIKNRRWEDELEAESEVFTDPVEAKKKQDEYVKKRLAERDAKNKQLTGGINGSN